jgi:hypothetical protein
MRLFSILIMIGQVLGVAYGMYSELAPPDWPLRRLPDGMGYSLSIISATMLFTLCIVEKERQDRAAEKKTGELWDKVAQGLSVCFPSHERDFYSLWAAQIATAQNNIDVTHLGPRPPQNRHGNEESKYFSDMKKLYMESSAQIRRVERLTPDKISWIQKLVKDFEGVSNFSLGVYRDPFEGEMPAALSVCRIDDRYAWIVAMAEHESTANYRDLLITGREGVDMVRRYFQDRLWNRSIVILDHGSAKEGWEEELLEESSIEWGV